MRPRIYTLLLLSCIFATACRKSAVEPDNVQDKGRQTTGPASTTPVISPVTSGLGADTADTNINGYMQVRLAKDSLNTDNILINFTPNSKTTYVMNEDAPTFQGFGKVSLSSLSSDNIPLAINTLPLTKQGLGVKLKINARVDGIYSINMMAIKAVPAKFDVWLMDHYKKDSLDMRLYPSYAFNILKADTSTFGSNRFKLVIRLHN